METMFIECDAKVDSNERLTLLERRYEYYHAQHYSDGRGKTLDMIDSSMDNLKNGKAGKAVDLSRFEE